QGEERVQVALRLGYATGQTDTGHERNGADDWLMKATGSGREVGPNHTAIQDFAHRAIHLTNVVGESLVDTYYSGPVEQKYYFGCSTGGRQGLTAMQRYPNDFDGIVAGAPVFSLPRLNMSQLWAAQQVAALKAEDELLTIPQLSSLKNAAVDACDALDGIEDRIIDDPRQCSVDPAAMQCVGSESSSSCLSEAQVEFVETIYRGPVSVAGERIYPGRTPGSEGPPLGGGMGGMGGWADLTSAECPNAAGTSRCDLVARAWYSDPDADVVGDFSIDDPEDVAFADSTYYSRAVRAENPDVTPFVKGGGKAILYHGWSDTSVTPITTIELYEAMDATVSRKRGESDFASHVRLFMAPAMGHCGGGDGPNNYVEPVLEALDAWVTEDRSPDSMIVSHDQRGMTRPWCPYPQVARLREPGADTDVAENFVCRNP
ncbi:MAG: tannase/feruloyl esterase family alpha/beta hydrolase, partial [Gammaproteobacteria bacterium]